jgi:L-alanine-DL-glutamate epimerase-like enolase superfamily enzyme
MRIVDVRAIPLQRDLERVFQGGTYQITNRYTLVTEVELENGIVGQTFGGDECAAQSDITALINDTYRRLLTGSDIFRVEQHWDAMFRTTALDGRNRGIHSIDLALKSTIMQAIAAVDIAMWDAIGKTLGLPLNRLLGGYRDKVPVIAIGGYYWEGKVKADYEEELRGYQAAGVAGIKFKVGRLSPRDDAERVRLVREITGPEFVIACDVNQGWTVDQAMEFCRAARDYNLRWIEEPVHWYDQLRGLAQVRTCGIPVVAGQGEICRYGCRDLMLSGAVDILNVDATIAGGITEWRRISAMAGMMNIGMGHHEEPQIAIHLLSAEPHGMFVEIFPDPLRDPMWFELPCAQPLIENGFMHVPQGAGVGIPLRADVVERYRGTPFAVS